MFIHNGERIPPAPPKTPNEILDWGIKWDDWLYEGEEILSSIWYVPAGLVGGVETITPGITGITLSGGTLGKTYKLTNRITTLQRVGERSMFIHCQNK